MDMAEFAPPAFVELEDAYAIRSHNHEARILQVVARGMGVNVGAEEEAYWRAGSKVAAAVDSLVDEEGVEDLLPIFNAIMNGQPVGPEGTMTKADAEEAADVFHWLPLERQLDLCQRIASLPEYAKRKAAAETVGTLIATSLDEAEQVFANGFKLESQGRSDETAREGFNTWLTHFARAGYMIDSALDMPKDYKRGIIQIRPSVPNRFEMIKAVRADIPRCFKVGHVALAEFVRTGRATIKERNR